LQAHRLGRPCEEPASRGTVSLVAINSDIIVACTLHGTRLLSAFLESGDHLMRACAGLPQCFPLWYQGFQVLGKIDSYGITASCLQDMFPKCLRSRLQVQITVGPLSFSFDTYNINLIRAKGPCCLKPTSSKWFSTSTPTTLTFTQSLSPMILSQSPLMLERVAVLVTEYRPVAKS